MSSPSFKLIPNNIIMDIWERNSDFVDLRVMELRQMPKSRKRGKKSFVVAFY